MGEGWAGEEGGEEESKDENDCVDLLGREREREVTSHFM